MEAFVITILDHDKSTEAAMRCIESGDKHLTEVKMWPATVPGDELESLMKKEKIPDKLFLNSKYSKPKNAMAAFMSHYSLWKKSATDKIDILILEHDAIFINFIPNEVGLGLITSLGAPSYGKFKTPSVIGVGPLISKRYFPGAHGYVIKPNGAKELVKKAKECAQPTDVFLNLDNFPNLKEYYPWCIEVKDEFTTIQMETGCKAKHSYTKNPEEYELINV